MTYYRVDTIIRNFLLRNGYSIHWYLQSLVYTKDCLREMQFQLPLPNSINSKNIPVNTTDRSVTLPDDYHDFCGVGIPVGQFTKPLLQYEPITRIKNLDTNTGLPTTYGSNDNVITVLQGNINWYYSVTNNVGEHIGRQFGRGAGREFDTFKIIKERNEIQLNENLSTDFIVLDYISDGMDVDAATRVDPYTQSAIEAYIKWQMKECRRDFSEGEKQRAKGLYEEEINNVRAYLSDVTLDDVKRSLRRSYKSAVRQW